jgi:hypothetical protein
MTNYFASSLNNADGATGSWVFWRRMAALQANICLTFKACVHSAGSLPSGRLRKRRATSENQLCRSFATVRFEIAVHQLNTSFLRAVQFLS